MAAEYSTSGDVPKLQKRLNSRIGAELRERFAGLVSPASETLWDMLEDISRSGERFVFVIDEWDAVMREARHNDAEIRAYLDFLRNLLKDRAYVTLAYLTGILPVKKSGSHSALNMFREYSVINPGPTSEYFGFTADEVRALCRHKNISFERMQDWYDGYTAGETEHIFNPISVVMAIEDGKFLSYWSGTESWEALREYLELDIAGLQDKVIQLAAGGSVKIRTAGFASDMTAFNDWDDVLTLLTHLGYLTAEPPAEDPDEPDACLVRIPDREIVFSFVYVIEHSAKYRSTAASVR